jgi:hypothetical protein
MDWYEDGRIAGVALAAMIAEVRTKRNSSWLPEEIVGNNKRVAGTLPAGRTGAQAGKETEMRKPTRIITEHHFLVHAKLG